MSLVQGFLPSSATVRHQKSLLHLLPTDGLQLVEASHSVYCEKSGINIKEQQQQPTSASSKARAFVARVFSLPSTRKHPQEQETNDICLYPIVGFRFVGNDNRALPTTINVSCRLTPQEPLYGWFRPAATTTNSNDDMSM
jgi:hypothetical protein